MTERATRDGRTVRFDGRPVADALDVSMAEFIVSCMNRAGIPPCFKLARPGEPVGGNEERRAKHGYVPEGS